MCWRANSGTLSRATFGDVNVITVPIYRIILLASHIWRRRCVLRATFGYLNVFVLCTFEDVKKFEGYIWGCKCVCSP
jgi:hypothetical protein